jgi:hypothetical protein
VQALAPEPRVRQAACVHDLEVASRQAVELV